MSKPTSAFCFTESEHFNPLNAELNPICHLLALLEGATIVDVSGLRVKSYILFDLQLLNYKSYFLFSEFSRILFV
jgi:hypothetical protein